MLSTNVLCIKKRKKRSYCIATRTANDNASATEKTKRSAGGAATMLHITEDTPPDMLVGAMDLTVHLPSGKTAKMSVERSTPMMDLLVQITTNNHLQLSNYTLQALGMAPSGEHSDRILPFKPNTPIGALDTQDIKVISKGRTLPASKNVPQGHQPFESTFRLKVHLPRNQLFVTRVSQSVLLENIMKKVCEEKNLDPLKYEFRHPGNLDQVLDPKLTLSDYQITEIYVVSKGTLGLNQAFSTSDIMALRKEEERKQMHNKTGGGVFNLIFRRGKSSTGSGSLSSENRSISPTQSDDSRSVTPPAVAQPIITPPPIVERPKPPQRKRRPAPKPPQVQKQETVAESPNEQQPPKKSENGLTICHSRNSSDSSGYHEASILSDNCNTSLPRRPKSTIIEETPLNGDHSQSTSNLNKMAAHSKSTSSLAFASRKKKIAPPPPPVIKSAPSVTSLEQPSPVVASQPIAVAPITELEHQETPAQYHPQPTPRIHKVPPTPRPRSFTSGSEKSFTETSEVISKVVIEEDEEHQKPENVIVTDGVEEIAHIVIVNPKPKDIREEPKIREEIVKEHKRDEGKIEKQMRDQKSEDENIDEVNEAAKEDIPSKHYEDILKKEKENYEDLVKEDKVDILPKEEQKTEKTKEEIPKVVGENKREENLNLKLSTLQKQNVNNIFHSEQFATKKPEIVAVIPKAGNCTKSVFDSRSRKSGFQIGSSLIDQQSDDSGSHCDKSLSSMNSVSSALDAYNFIDEISDVDVDLFTAGSVSRVEGKEILNELHGIHVRSKKYSLISLHSVDTSIPGFVEGNMKKWKNVEELDEVSLVSGDGTKWVLGDTSDTESVLSTTMTPIEIFESEEKIFVEEPKIAKEMEGKAEVEVKEEKKELEHTEETVNDLETDWQYQLPSPPKAFRDSSPEILTNSTANDQVDSVVTSPELFEKLKTIKDSQSEKETVSDLTSVVSEDEKQILNTLSLENLEKRKSLVYNRELATSLKMTDDIVNNKNEAITTTPTTKSEKIEKFEKFEDVKRSSLQNNSTGSTLPNFKITTYDNPKQKINIFEDDTIRSNTHPTANTLNRSQNNQSMENIALRKNSWDGDGFKKPTLRPKSFAPKFTSTVLRSESFSMENSWKPSKLVARSKSHIALNKYREDKIVQSKNEENLSKSSSLFDVSGLQSLEVMRLIQNKLNTPNNSMEDLDKIDEIKKEEKPVKKEEPPIKTYQYRGVPSINMSTWSERPKIPVNVKADPDYKISNNRDNYKLTVNTSNIEIKNNHNRLVSNNFTNNNPVNVRVNQPERNVSIKINGYEPPVSGNVVIKIGSQNTKPFYRKPFSDIKNDVNQRPHSIAIDSDFDISRIPVVRSVEFKKPFKEFQKTTITQINSSDDNSQKTLTNLTNGLRKIEPPTKPVFRVNSYVNSTPVVRGFNSNRISWNQPHSFSTLPTNKTNSSTTIISQTNPQSNLLRRTESSKVTITTPAPPPPPPVIQNGFRAVKNEENLGDTKEQLMQAIRDFGGKKGLRAVKA